MPTPVSDKQVLKKSAMKPWLRWLLLALFLVALGVIQFIPA